MSTLRSVGGWGKVDLDQRAITTEEDIVDLSELDRSGDQHSEPAPAPAPAPQNGAAGHDEPGEAQTPAAASSPNRTATLGETPPTSDALGHESDEEFDRWVAHRAPRLGSGPSASTPGIPRLASDARELPSGGAPPIASATDTVAREPTVPAVTGSRSRLRRTGPLSLPLGRLARPAAAMALLTLTAGGTAIAINAATTSTPHAQPQISTSNAALIAGQSSRPGDALSATMGAVAVELHALARAVHRAHRTSHLPRELRRHHGSRHARVSGQHHPAAVSERKTATAQATPAIPPAPQPHNYTPPSTSASSSSSQTSAGSQTPAPSRSQPAGPTNQGPLGGIGSCVKGCT